MKILERIALLLIFLAAYLLLPLLILNYTNDISQAGLIILLVLTFISFAINMLVTYFKGKHIEVPILSVVTATILFYTFNSSAVVPLILIFLMSFLAYYLGSIFSIKEKDSDD
ncbi:MULTISPECIES: hypothetical protein [unclassified Gemella]|uniref:hypothetical protein n=1 Tax=unclassified Gemella TaxID=2624949 RepID=UPI001073186A|nr:MULTISPECIES: hypothetical protein [unclassified Gemella]MBF0709820.1 hypothetical protein [Gemella sp. GL1.1]MBF0747091.1 hypothetical protein [Gemella sp. 19428wG2_WT2a]NYS27164.1 hypothetical protein [Gemella sp. GL1]TFU58334.1 hypothetical protein E4T67_05445 [Gemella sp. WT2a]